MGKEEDIHSNHQVILEAVIWLYLNFLFLKQVVINMFLDLRFSHALRTQSMTTLDLRENAEKEEPVKEFNVIRSLFNTVRYTVIDGVLLSLLIWFFGASSFV